MYIVTGVSKGLGKAVVELLLEKGETVLGIGRNSVIEHKNYSFQRCDLSNSEQVENLKLSIPNELVTLINNAGIIGEIKRLSDQKHPDLATVLQINTVAPMLLMQKIYQAVEKKDSFTLVNISSGAANKAIPSWAGYCASKAALNMLTEAFYLEELEKGNSPKVFAISPGVIDTEMQVQIRRASENDFSAVENFKKMKEDDQLFSPKEAAKRLLNLLSSPNYTGVFHDLRNS
ncbi:MAG: SDR family NAD(P)-dependent oxidoreductase [Fluviicola sp.]|nr:SDR family NAD(P)-dependent oxidoreductase [Fluviicola sp.]